MIKTLLQFGKKRKMISRQRRKIVIFNVEEMKVVNPCGISFRGIGLHIIHDVEIFTALVFLRTLSNHKLWECNAHALTAFIEVHHVKVRVCAKFALAKARPTPTMSIPPSVSRAPEKANLTSRTVLSCLTEG